MKKDVMFGVLLAVVAAMPAVGADTAPYAWWKMDEISEGLITDASGHGRNLKVGSGCSVTNCADVGSAVYFDGSLQAWGQTTVNLAMPWPGARTVSLWLYREATDTTVGSDSNKIPFLFTSLSGLYANWGNGQIAVLTCAGNPAIGLASALKPSRGTWHHLAWTFEITNIESYVVGGKTVYTNTCNLVQYCDGEVVETLNGIRVPGDQSFSSKLLIGNNGANGAGYRPMFGALKDVRIYDTLLSAAEIIEQYVADQKTFAPQMLGFWPMEAFGTSTAGNKIIQPSLSSLGAELRSGDGIELVEDGVTGKCAYFPNLTTTWMLFFLPRSTAGFSWGAWMKFGTNLPDLEKEDINNKFPHLFSFGSYGRACVEGTYRTLTDNRCHIFDVKTFDDGADQGFVCPCVTAQKGEWCHFGMTYEMAYLESANAYAVTPKIYVDGVCVCTGRTQSATALTGIYTKGLPFSLGNNGMGGTRPFGGWMDDFCYVEGVLDEAGMADLARGLPSVSAGDDFTVATASTRLNGVIGRMGTRGGRPAARTTWTWSLVSAPEGGEGAAFLNADDPQTAVTLPALGAYVFRLTAKMACGPERHDDVTITRVSPAGGTAPTVSVAGAGTATAYVPLALTATANPSAARISWKRVSGPGAVRFEPAWGAETKATFFVAGTYEIAAVATDGENETTSATLSVAVGASDAINLESGLLGYWPFDLAKNDKVSGTSFTSPNIIDGEANAKLIAGGVDGYGVAVFGGVSTNYVKDTLNCAGPHIDTGLLDFIGEESVTPEGEQHPTVKERWRSISCWVYHDSANTNNPYNAVIAGAANGWGLWYRSQDGEDGFTMYQRHLTDGSPTMNFPKPTVDPKDRWTHLYAVFDRNTKTGNQSALWVDGVKQTATSGVLKRGRALSAALMIGGHTKSGWNGKDAPAGFYIVDGVVRPRTFPGAIDEVRVYNRVLNDAEIKYLAANPVVDIPRAPAIGGEPAELELSRKAPTAISVFVNADSYPAGTALTYRWCVLSGDAENLTFADPEARETTLTFRRAGSYVIQLAVSDGSRTVYSAPIPVSTHRDGFILTIR